MKKSDVIMGSRESCQLVVASLSVLLWLVALQGPAFAGLSGKIASQNARQRQPQGGQVMPPNAKPLGFSLTDMAGKNAQFVTSGNMPQFLPTTPFQFLYGDPKTISVSSVPSGQGNGLLETGSNTFRVPVGTKFYVPIQNVDDSPPIIGTFPTSSSMAASYWFDSSQLGGADFIEVDGNTTSIGATYLVGPITTQPLQDGGGTHIITIGVFLTPLNKGSHTVSIRARFDGAAILASGISFFEGVFTYTVIVQ